MGRCALLLLLVVATWANWAHARTELEVLLEVKAALDPRDNVLMSWGKGRHHCDGSFEGVGCNSGGRVTNISLQGRALSGSLPSALSELKALSSLFLHYNNLEGVIPRSLSALANLTDLYLNVNHVSGIIPPELGLLSSLKVMELCCNQLEGPIPAELGNLTQLTVLALNGNHLNGSVPESLGNLSSLTRLDISYDLLSGSIPVSFAKLTNLTSLDVRNNSLSGPIPSGLFRLQQNLQYSNNRGLCGKNYTGLSPCPPGPSPSPTDPSSKSSKAYRLRTFMSLATAVILAIGGSALLISVFIWARRRKVRQRLARESQDGKPARMSATSDGKRAESITSAQVNGSSSRSTPNASILGKSRAMSDRSTLTVASKALSSPSEWSLWIHLDELEIATNYFSERNLLGKNVHSAVYKGTLRDGSVVAVKAIYNTRSAFGERDIQQGIEALMQIKHENLVNFLGFCCSKGGDECYLVYNFVSNGSVEQHLHHGNSEFLLDWPMRVKIARGVAKGLAYLHEGIKDQVMVHQNLWGGNVLLDRDGEPLLSDYALFDIGAEEVMYSTHKTLAALGYLAPEYPYMGHQTHESDVFAFGALLLELLTGRRPTFLLKESRTLMHTATWIRPLLELGRVTDFVDPKLGKEFSLAGAAGLAHIALQCMSEEPCGRPSMGNVVQRLRASDSWVDTAMDSFLLPTPRRKSWSSPSPSCSVAPLLP